ncbi:hypothetical protein [Streptomyces sp. C36]|uniref:hypothetical protein n=1 Tax=Streptomyces sp. C36 TaxID=3237122 RepID=UPI0034C63FBA
MLRLARRIVGEYPPRSVTLRQVQYRCATAGAIPNTTSAYKRLSSLIAQARRTGTFPDLIDSTREVHRPQAFADVGDMLRRMPDFFGLDPRRGQRGDLGAHVAAHAQRGYRGWGTSVQPLTQGEAEPSDSDDQPDRSGGQQDDEGDGLVSWGTAGLRMHIAGPGRAMVKELEQLAQFVEGRWRRAMHSGDHTGDSKAS